MAKVNRLVTVEPESDEWAAITGPFHGGKGKLDPLAEAFRQQLRDAAPDWLYNPRYRETPPKDVKLETVRDIIAAAKRRREFIENPSLEELRAAALAECDESIAAAEALLAVMLGAASQDTEQPEQSLAAVG